MQQGNPVTNFYDLRKQARQQRPKENIIQTQLKLLRKSNSMAFMGASIIFFFFFSRKSLSSYCELTPWHCCLLDYFTMTNMINDSRKYVWNRVYIFLISRIEIIFLFSYQSLATWMPLDPGLFVELIGKLSRIWVAFCIFNTIDLGFLTPDGSCSV